MPETDVTETAPPEIADAPRPASERPVVIDPEPSPGIGQRPDAATTVAVVVPCYNEAAAIADVVADFRRALPAAEIHVFDNASSDDTAGIARRSGAVVHHVGMRGKGNVVRRMFADVDADIYVMVDGDATYEADAAPRLIDLLLEQGLDMVVGQRVTKEDESAGEEYRSGHQLGNAAFTRLYNVLFGTQFEDVFSGYRVMTKRFVKSFPVTTSGFDIETELIVHSTELRVEVGELPTEYVARPEGSDSKLSTYKDGWRILTSAIRLYKGMAPVRFFGILAALSTAAAWILGIPIISEFIDTGLVERFPTAFLAASLQVIALVLATAGLVINAVEQVSREQRQLTFLGIPRPPVPQAPSARPGDDGAGPPSAG